MLLLLLFVVLHHVVYGLLNMLGSEDIILSSDNRIFSYKLHLLFYFLNLCVHFLKSFCEFFLTESYLCKTCTIFVDKLILRSFTRSFFSNTNRSVRFILIFLSNFDGKKLPINHTDCFIQLIDIWLYNVDVLSYLQQLFLQLL